MTFAVVSPHLPRREVAHADEIRDYTAQIIAARIEYRDHPLAKSCGGSHRCTANYLRHMEAA